MNCRQAVLVPLQFLVVFCAGWVNRRQQTVIEYLRTENAVLREVLGGRPLLDDRQRRRLAVAGKELGRGVLAEIAEIATPDTILRWWRTLVAQKYDGTARRGPGRPRIRESIASLIVRIAKENPGFGYTRIRDAIENLERTLGRSTVKRVLDDHGIVPSPERRRRTSWRDFLATHLDGLFGGDFFTVEVLTIRGLVRYHVLFFMELKTRRVHVAGISADPSQAWMLQVARNLTDVYDGFLRDAKHVILDRDPLFTTTFRQVFEDRGTRVLRLPRRSPNLNAYCERWIRSIRAECLDRIVPLGERHLERAIREFVIHYHRERNHQALEGALIEPEPRVPFSADRILCRMRLGGLLRYYHRSAA